MKKTSLILITVSIALIAILMTINKVNSDKIDPQVRADEQAKEAREDALRMHEAVCNALRNTKIADMTPNQLAELRDCNAH
jgi:hypothetical protein